MNEEIIVDKNVIKMKIDYNPNSSKLILMVHGFGGEGKGKQFEKTAELFYSSGYNTARFLFSGYTENILVENPSIKRQMKELNEIIKYFSAKGFKIIVFAQSLGCPTALLSDLKKVKALILLAPAVNPAKTLGKEFMELDKESINRLENNQKFIFSYTNKNGTERTMIIHPSFWKELKEIGDINYSGNKPVLIFQGKNDDTVDIEDVKELYESIKAKKKIYFTEGQHVQIKDEEIRKFIAEKSVEWLNELNL